MVPKYTFHTEIKTIYHVDWPDTYTIMRGDLKFTYYKNKEEQSCLFTYKGYTSIPCMGYSTKGYGPYQEEILLDLEGNVHPRYPQVFN